MPDDKVYLPRQYVKRGVAGYAGKNVVIVDRDKKEVSASDDAKAAKVVTTAKAKADGE